MSYINKDKKRRKKCKVVNFMLETSVIPYLKTT
jgi:hypothetical protein